MDKERIRIGRRFRDIRTALKMTQQEVAEKLGKRQSNIGRVERGDVNPGFDFMQDMAEIYGMKVDIVLDREVNHITTLNVSKREEKEFLEACANMGSDFKFAEIEDTDESIIYAVNCININDLFNLGYYFGAAVRGSGTWETR